MNKSMLWGLNPNFLQTCCVTSGRSLHISEPQLLPLEHPLPYKLPSQVVLAVKSPPANAGGLRDAGSSLGGEDPLEEGMATHSSILAWRILMDRGAWWATDHGVTTDRHH